MPNVYTVDTNRFDLTICSKPLELLYYEINRIHDFNNCLESFFCDVANKKGPKVSW